MERRKASQSLIAFAGYTNDLYMPAGHHWLIADALERVEAGLIDRLMIFMPPRHGKSELGSRRFPAWYLGRNPINQIIATSYGGELAQDFGRDVRNIMDSQEFWDVFPGIELSHDSKAAQRWNTNKGGQYIAAGVCGPVTGRGAHVLLIDDPVKDRDEADSELRRIKVWNWYTSTAYPRLMPGGSIVLIQTRWHEDDLAGRLIEAQKHGGDQWEILNLPAIDLNGDALWPSWYPIEKLRQIKNVIGRRDWNSLYQQEPTPDEGSYFKRDDLRYYENLPAHLMIYGASDYAVTDDGGDYTEHGVIGVDPNDDIYIIDWWFGKTDTDVWIEELFRLAEEYKIIEWGEEAGQIEKSVGPFIKKRMRDEKIYFYRKQWSSAKDKPTRAQAIRGRAQQNKIYFPSKPNDWTDHVINQMMAFPAGKNDDSIDVLSIFGRMLARMEPGREPAEEKEVEYQKDLRKMTLNQIMERLKRKRIGDD